MYYTVSQNVIKVFEYQSYIFVHFDTWHWENFSDFKMSCCEDKARLRILALENRRSTEFQ